MSTARTSAAPSRRGRSRAYSGEVAAAEALDERRHRSLVLQVSGVVGIEDVYLEDHVDRCRRHAGSSLRVVR